VLVVTALTAIRLDEPPTTATGAGSTGGGHLSFSGATGRPTSICPERFAPIQEVPVDDDTQTTIWRERIGTHAWTRPPVPIDLRADPIASAVARRRARHRRH